MNNWTVRFISQAGKEVLLKAIIQAIPSYCMSIFKLPRLILQAINRQVKNFWWGSRGEKTKMQWLPWNLLGSSKMVGGLGFRDFEHFNAALLAKQGWRLIQNLGSLAEKVLKAKYYSRTDFLNSKVGSNASYIWRSFSSIKTILRGGSFWRIGNGASVVIGKDNWIPQTSNSLFQSPLHERISIKRVRDLIIPESKSWNMHLISQFFNVSDATTISMIPISPSGCPDRCIWKGTKNGKFTVKSAYHCINQLKIDSMGQCSYSDPQKGVWRKIWSMLAPNASKMILWRATHDSLPTNLNLNRRHIRESPLCPICSQENEYVVHALWACIAAQDIWGASSRKLQKMSFRPLHFNDLVCHLFNKLSAEEMEFFTATTYLIWKRRNSFVFESYFEDPASILISARQQAVDYRMANSLPG